MSSLPGFKTGIPVEVRQPGGKLPLDQMSFRMCNRVSSAEAGRCFSKTHDWAKKEAITASPKNRDAEIYGCRTYVAVAVGSQDHGTVFVRITLQMVLFFTLLHYLLRLPCKDNCC